MHIISKRYIQRTISYVLEFSHETYATLDNVMFLNVIYARLCLYRLIPGRSQKPYDKIKFRALGVGLRPSCQSMHQGGRRPTVSGGLGGRPPIEINSSKDTCSLRVVGIGSM